MKNRILPFVYASLVLSFTACAPKTTKPDTDLVNVGENGDNPKMKFEEEKHDFGKITQGQRVSYGFRFRNVGGSDLVINDAHGSCGCTVPDYPRDRIPVGKEGVINVQFNSEGKSGVVEKTVTLATNCTPSTVVLTIKAEVLTPQSTPKN